ENGITFYDETNNTIYSNSAGGSIYRATSYNLTTNTWGNWGTPWSQYANAADERHDRIVTIMVQPAPGYPGKYWRLNLNTYAVDASGDFQYGGGFSAANFT